MIVTVRRATPKEAETMHWHLHFGHSKDFAYKTVNTTSLAVIAALYLRKGKGIKMVIKNLSWENFVSLRATFDDR